MMFTTRIAPAPSGMFHLGTARTAYHNWLAARASGGRFILRIDDTDAASANDRYIGVIVDALRWLGLDYDHIFRQSERRLRHLEVVEALLDAGKAVRRDGAVVLPASADETWNDLAIGSVTGFPIDTVLLRSDGAPTYHLASVVDDFDHGITLVIRGQDHVSNTARQIALYRALNWGVPQYAHVGLIHKEGKKMSKRDGAASLLDYQERGYHPAAILNYILRLGWGPTVDDKSANFLPMDKAMALFLRGGKLRGAPANFDQAKLDWLDRKYKAIKYPLNPFV